MIVTVANSVKELKLAIDDKHAERVVTLPNGSTELMRNLDGTTIHLEPTGRVGVPMTMPNPVLKGKR